MDHILAMLQDLKSHLEHGGQLAGSHLPVLADVAAKIADDPFVQLAINTLLSPEGKVLVSDLVHRLEAYEQAHAAAAEAPADPAPAG